MYHNPPVRAVSMSHVIQCITHVSRLYHDVSRALGRGPRIEPGDTMYHDISRLYHDVSRNLGRGPRIKPGDTVYYEVSGLYHM